MIFDIDINRLKGFAFLVEAFGGLLREGPIP
jgi:hypothetical protein